MSWDIVGDTGGHDAVDVVDDGEMDVVERKRDTTISEEEILNKVRQKGTPHQASKFRCWRMGGASVGDLILFRGR